MSQDVAVEVCLAVGPVSCEVADTLAAEASGATCRHEVDHRFIQFVREQEAAEDSCRIGHLRVAMMRSDPDGWIC